MLYLLIPPATLLWCSMPGSMIKAVDTGVDWTRLDWEASERPFTSDLLAIALRNGVATSNGIIVDGTQIADVGRVDELRRVRRQSDAAHAQVRESHGELLEGLMPGWAVRDDELERGAHRSIETAIRETNASLATALAAPLNPDLVGHWHSLGGSLLN